MTEEDYTILSHMTAIVTSYIARNDVSDTTVPNLPDLIRTVYSTLKTLDEVETPKEELVPAVPIKESVFRDHIICLEDGRPFKMLKRHLSDLGMTPDEYRAKWGLPETYPMVCPEYAETRSALAKSIGLGRKRAA